MKIKTIISSISALLILLYVYTAASKLLSLPEFQMQMRMQALPARLKEILIWTLPPAELLAAVLLFSSRYKLLGFWISALLLMAFTTYIGLALFHAYDRMPCSCGGVLRHMSWETHFYFNVFFLLFNFIAIALMYRERRITAQ